jgi:hypothetical protein
MQLWPSSDDDDDDFSSWIAVGCNYGLPRAMMPMISLVGLLLDVTVVFLGR